MHTNRKLNQINKNEEKKRKEQLEKKNTHTHHHRHPFQDGSIFSLLNYGSACVHVVFGCLHSDLLCAMLRITICDYIQDSSTT